MNDTLTRRESQQMLLFVAEKMIAEEENLNKADSLGDSDHGTGMKTGFLSVREKLTAKEYDDLAELFRTAGMAIMMSAGGSSGVIFGEMFRGGASAFRGSANVTPDLFAQFIAMSAAAIMKRGQKQRGEKTMLDALLPAAEVAQEEKNQNDFAAFLWILHQAAEQGSQATADMLAGAGRMQTLGERAKGCIDPGSISVSLIFLSMYQYVKSLES